MELSDYNKSRDSGMAPGWIRLARRAMGTRFEFLLGGDRPDHVRAAGEEALDEISRLETQLSIFRINSDISKINRGAGGEPIRVEPRLFSLLERIMCLSEWTEGAFDVTAGPLVRVWGFHEGTGRVPEHSALVSAQQRVGWHRMELNQQERSVRLTRSGMLLDLGSIGKGYALDRAVEILRDEEVRSGLIHGGTSTVSAWGKAPDQGVWKVSLAERPEENPSIEPARETSEKLEKLGADCVEYGKIIELHDESLSMSAVWGKAFVQDNVVLGHVLDPRTGQPVRGDTLAAAVAMRSATDSDALATALLVMGPEGRRRIQERFPESRVWC